MKKYGTKNEWNLQMESVSLSRDDRGVLAASATFESMISLPTIPRFPVEAINGGPFPFNDSFGVFCYCNKVTIGMRVGFVTVTAYYVGLEMSTAGSGGRSEVRTEWMCSTQASPIQTHPQFNDLMKQHAVMEDDIFVDFPASADLDLGGVTDFLEPAPTLRISWVENYSDSTIKEWTALTGKICEPPSWAKFTKPSGDYNFILSSFSFGFFAKPPSGGDAKYADCSLDFQLSQEGGWNETIYETLV